MNERSGEDRKDAPQIIAYYDPSTRVVSTDKNDPRFGPLAQIWPLERIVWREPAAVQEPVEKEVTPAPAAPTPLIEGGFKHVTPEQANPAARTPRMFPVDGGDIPWCVIEPHDRQARKNHSQTLERLAERGGLSACEALAILEGRAWEPIKPQAQAVEQLRQLVHDRYYLIRNGQLERENAELRQQLAAAKKVEQLMTDAIESLNKIHAIDLAAQAELKEREQDEMWQKLKAAEAELKAIKEDGAWACLTKQLHAAEASRRDAVVKCVEICDAQQIAAEKRAEVEYINHNTGWAMGAINCSRDIRAEFPEAFTKEQP